MPNIKSAKKRVLVTEAKTFCNKDAKNEVKTAIKKLNLAIDSGDVETAKSLMPATFALIDSSVNKGIMHKNTAANKKSGLAKRINALSK